MLILYCAIGALVVFLALTRTKVGRDGLRVQMEEQFNATFVGNITIGKLEGNLLNTLYAEDISFYDGTGIQVATIDAAILQPSWIELMRKTIAMRRITLVKPELEIVQRDDATWNIQDLFKRKDGRPPQLFFNSSDIRIIDGVAETYARVEISPPDSSIAGEAHRTFEQIQAQLNVETRLEAQLMDIQYANFVMPREDITVQDLHGQVFVGKGRIELNDVYLRSDDTRLELTASVNNVDSLMSAPSASHVEIDLRDSVVDFDAAKRLIPSLPFAETVFVSARIQGPVSDLSVQTMQLAHNNLVLDAGARIQGLPDSANVSFDLSNSSFYRDDLSKIVPTLQLETLSNEHVLFFHTLYGRGVFHPFDTLNQQLLFGDVNFGFTSPGGHLEGNIELSRNNQDSLSYLYSIIQADSFNIASLISTQDINTTLNGSVYIEGSGPTFDNLETDIRVRLGTSNIAGNTLDSLDTYLYTDGRAIELQGSVQSNLAGQVTFDATYNLQSNERPIEASLYLDALDVKPLIKSDSFHTNIDGSLFINLTHASPAHWRGEIQVELDSSSVTHGSITKSLPANQLTLALRDINASTQRFSIDGDMGILTVDGVLEPAILSSLGSLWAETFSNNVSEIIHKERPGTLNASLPLPGSNTAERDTVMTQKLAQLAQIARDQLSEYQQPVPHILDIDFKLQQAEYITPWFAHVPSFSSNLNGAIQIQSDVEELRITGSLHADSLISEAIQVEQMRGTLDLTNNRTRLLEDQLTFKSSFQADSLHFIGQVFPQTTLYASLENHAGTLDILTKSTNKVGPQKLASTFELRPDKNIVHINDLLLSVGNSFWTIGSPTSLDVYGQSLVIPELLLESKSPEANILQSVHLSGVLSPSPSDTASIRIDDIAIRPISQFLNMKVPLGGLLNGQLAFTTTDTQPELTGLLQVDRFSFDTRVIGDVSLASRYIPGEPDVGLRIEVAPVEPYNQEEFLPDAALPAIYEENEMVIDGTFRLPRFNQTATGFIDAGDIDLDVDMTRVDVFFFEYIFSNLLERTDGYLAGNGNIRGDFGYPEFDLGLRIQEGELYIPKFNLRYTEFEGPLRIDDEGIKLQNATFKDLTGGQATINGGFLFNEYKYFSFDLEAKLNEILIMNQDNAQDLPFYGQIWGSGTLQLTGPTNNAFLFSQDAITKASSELFVPVTEEDFAFDEGFIVFADSAGNIPDFSSRPSRRNILSKRPEGERKFIDGLDMDLNITVPNGSTLHLVFDPLLGDVINAVSSGRVQLQKREGEFSTYGTLSVESGDYLFTAGDVFARRFIIERGGTITWDGNPINARLDIPASYKTRASTAGLPENPFENSLIPLIVRLDIEGRVSSPQVNLSLESDRSDRNYTGSYEGIEVFLNQSGRRTDLATSVLLTNSFLLTTEASPNSGALTNSGEQLAFSSVSQLVSSQLNRFLNEAIPNADFNLGLQGESLDDPDVTYGVALYLLNERLVIRGQGVYQRDLAPNQSGLEGEFEVEVRLTPNVSVSVFLRQEGDVLAQNELTRARGAGISYQTQFSSWRSFLDRLFGWVGKKKSKPTNEEPVAQGPDQEE